MTDALEFLKSHRFFKNLPQKQVEELLQYCRVLEYPAGGTVFYQNELVDTLILVMQGCLLFGEERAFAGNTLFLSHLALPEKLPHSLEVRDTTRIILLSREAFLSWLDRFPKAVKRLGSSKRFRSQGGFPGAFWKDYGMLLPQKKAQAAAARPLLVLREWWLIWLMRQWWVLGGFLLTLLLPVPPLLLWFWLIPLTGVFLIRRANGLVLNHRAVIGRIFRVKGMNRRSMKIPLEQILAVETHRKGILQAIFRLGSLSMKTSTLEGSITVRNLHRADRAEALLNKLRTKEESRRDLMTALKEARQRRAGNPLAPRLLYKGPFCSAGPDLPGQYRFKKSLYALLKRTLLPLLVLSLFLFFWLTPLLSQSWTYLFGFCAFFPFAVILYRWQDWRNDTFKVEGDHVYDVDRKPLGKEMTRRQVSLESMENISASQKGLFPLLFNSGEVQILLPGNTSDFVFEDVSDPWYVQDQLLRLRWMEMERKKKQESQVREEELLTLADLLSQELSENSRS